MMMMRRPEGAVDIHTHILPGMDDGAEDLGESVAMGRLAAEHGTAIMVATPHMDFAGAKRGACAEGARKADLVRRNTGILATALAASGLPVEVLPGMEIAIDPDLLSIIEAGEAVTIADSGKYVLVELPFGQLPGYTEKVMFDLSSAGYVPVIAHPERNAEIANDPNRMFSLVRAGAIGQLDAGSLAGELGRATRRAAEALLRHGLAHVIASDGHSPSFRPCRLDRAFAAAARLVGDSSALCALRDLPRAIVRGEAVRLEDPEKYAPRRWFLFGRMAI